MNLFKALLRRWRGEVRQPLKVGPVVLFCKHEWECHEPSYSNMLMRSVWICARPGCESYTWKDPQF